MIRPALLLVGYLLFIASLWACFVYTPEHLASHFGLDGAADGSGSRETFLLIMAAVGLMPALIVLIAAFAPISMLNIPNRAYWTAPERATDTRRSLQDSMFSLAIILILFFAGLVLAVIEANHIQPARLDAQVFGPMVFFAVVGVLYQVVCIYRRFSVTS